MLSVARASWRAESSCVFLTKHTDAGQITSLDEKISEGGERRAWHAWVGVIALASSQWRMAGLNTIDFGKQPECSRDQPVSDLCRPSPFRKAGQWPHLSARPLPRKVQGEGMSCWLQIRGNTDGRGLPEQRNVQPRSTQR